jgi:aerobic carbon-monoxide dehydrogenase medium subunit
VTTLPPFELHRATSVAETTALLEELGDDAVIYAGGSELLLLMKLGFAEPAHLVDVKGVAELTQLTVNDAGDLLIGGAVAHRTLERSPLVVAGWPALAEMERMVANVRVRTVGTLGGNLAFADPHSDPATFLLAADATVILGRGDERREVPMGEFVLGPYTTALEPGEVIVAVRVPALPSGTAMAHHKFSFHERPAATVACLVTLGAAGIVEARIAVGSVGLAPARATAAEAALAGASLPLDAAILAEAGRLAAEAAEPVADANGAEDYKAALVAAMVERCLVDAAERAAGRHI